MRGWGLSNYLTIFFDLSIMSISPTGLLSKYLQALNDRLISTYVWINYIIYTDWLSIVTNGMRGC